jgi:hypothetical protein
MARAMRDRLTRTLSAAHRTVPRDPLDEDLALRSDSF